MRVQRLKAILTTVIVAATTSSAFAAGGIFSRVALLMPEQETPPVAGSNAIGCGTFIIDTCANTVRYYIVVCGLSSAETAAHIHGYVPPGVPGGVVHPLPMGTTKIGVWVYPEADELSILSGRAYVNVHTVANGGGEVRGQIVTHVAKIDGMQETPATGSAGTGWAVATVLPYSMSMDYYIVFGGLSSAEIAAHIHGPARHLAPAGVLHPLPAGSPKVGTWNFTAADEPAIYDGRIYINIHSVMFGGGEIRGQLTPLVNPIDGAQETPPIATNGCGCALLSIDDVANVLGYDISYRGLAGAETAAHIHGYAPRGTPAGVVNPLALGARKLGTWAYPAANEAQILGGMTYANVHSAVAGGGEIRGQLDFFPPLPCPEDINCDGVIDITDLSIQLANFGSTTANACDGDVDGDHDVDLVDLSLLLAVFGTGCP